MSKLDATAIIIGAGVSGIKAATELNKAGISTLILEARDRIGGRIHTYQPENSKYSYDIGACWFHSTIANPLFEKSVELGNIEYVFDDKSAMVFGPDGALPGDLHLGAIVDEIKLYAGLATKDQDNNLKQICSDYLFKNSKFLTEDQIKYAPSLLRFLEIPNGCSWDQFSAKLGNPGYGGRDAFVKSGYGKVLENELIDYPKSNILTSKIVQEIKKVSKGPHEHSIEVTTEDGKVYNSEYVIVTIPQSLLKLSGSDEKGSIKFEPELPIKIQENMKKTSFTSLSKVIFEFDKSFWPEVEKFIVIPKPDEAISVSATQEQVFKTIEHDKKPNKDDKLDVFEYPFLVANLQEVRGIPSLMFLAPAPVTHLLETKGEKYAWDLLKPIVSNIAGKSISELPEPKVTLITQWTVDPFSRGSISGNAPGDMLVNDSLIEGFGNIRFAGEATIYEGHGNVHGAYLSGMREASYIAGKLGKSVQ